MDAYGYLERLMQEVGARKAGTDGEKKAVDWLVARCSEIGLKTVTDPFKFVGWPRFRSAVNLAGFCIIGAGVWLIYTGNPLGGLAVIAFYFFYFFSLHKRVTAVIARHESRNVIAGTKRTMTDYMNDPAKGDALLVCAHYDTANASPRWAILLNDFYRFFGPLTLFGLMLVALYGLFRAFCGVVVLIPPHTVDLIFRILFFTGCAFAFPYVAATVLMNLWHLVLPPRKLSPGADDNGSGVAVALALAETVAATTDKDIFFAFWGAEEAGLFGSRQFLNRWRGKLDRNRLSIINIDCVGVGERLTVDTGMGTLRKKRFDPDMISLLEKTAAEFSVPVQRSWESIISGGSSDHASWIDRGFNKAVSLIREDSVKTSLPALLFSKLFGIPYCVQLKLDHIHSARDTLQVIDRGRLESSFAVARELLRRLAG